MAKKITEAEKKALGIAFLISGQSYYSSLAQPNTKGNYASNCYEVGIANPKLRISKKTSDEIADVIKEKFETEFLKTTNTEMDKDGECIIYTKIKNSKYPIPVFEENGKTKIDLPRIANGTEITAKCKLNYSEKFDSFYLTVVAVKLEQEYKVFNPFEDMEDFD